MCKARVGEKNAGERLLAKNKESAVIARGEVVAPNPI
jgi:hypothetical protein